MAKIDISYRAYGQINGVEVPDEVLKNKTAFMDWLGEWQDELFLSDIKDNLAEREEIDVTVVTTSDGESVLYETDVIDVY